MRVLVDFDMSLKNLAEGVSGGFELLKDSNTYFI